MTEARVMPPRNNTIKTRGQDRSVSHHKEYVGDLAFLNFSVIANKQHLIAAIIPCRYMGGKGSSIIAAAFALPVRRICSLKFGSI